MSSSSQILRRLLVGAAFCAVLAASAELSAQVDLHALRISAMKLGQTGVVPPPVVNSGKLVLALEADGSDSGILLQFDLSRVEQERTPWAQLQIELKSLTAHGLAARGSKMRGALHVWDRSGGADQAPRLAGSRVIQQQRGVVVPYIVDVTEAVNAALSRPPAERSLLLELRLSGKPSFAQVYGMARVLDSAPATPVVVAGLGSTASFSSAKAQGNAPALVLAPIKGWTDDFDRRIAPVWEGPVVYRESCLPIPKTHDEELTMKLLYPAKRILEVIRSANGEPLEEGRDWRLRDGSLIIPAGSRAPTMLYDEFFAPAAKPGSGAQPLRDVRVEDNNWYQQRQIEVTYEPASRDWSFAPQISSLADLPRLQRLLTAKSPVTVLAFGDSVVNGGNTSGYVGSYPYQENWPQLSCRALQRHYGSTVTYIHHCYSGTTAKWGVDHAESMAALCDPKPDLIILSFGGNDRHYVLQEKGEFRKNLERIIDIVRAKLPEAEFLLTTPMLNNPKQPGGYASAWAIRDEALKVDRPGVAFLDMMTVSQELLRHKAYLDISGNGINHPNDFRARIWAQRICQLLIPEKVASE